MLYPNLLNLLYIKVRSLSCCGLPSICREFSHRRPDLKAAPTPSLTARVLTLTLHPGSGDEVPLRLLQVSSWWWASDHGHD